jgi:hypothetical protein
MACSHPKRSGLRFVTGILEDSAGLCALLSFAPERVKAWVGQHDRVMTSAPAARA